MTLDIQTKRWFSLPSSERGKIGYTGVGAIKNYFKLQYTEQCKKFTLRYLLTNIMVMMEFIFSQKVTMLFIPIQIFIDDHSQKLGRMIRSQLIFKEKSVSGVSIRHFSHVL